MLILAQMPIPPPPGITSPGESKQNTSGGCGGLDWLLAAATFLIAAIVTYIATGRWPGKTQAQGNPPPESTDTAVSAFVKSDDGLITVALFYTLHNNLYEAVSVGVDYLKRIGMLYPDELDLPDPMFNQFTRLETPGPNTVHPHRPLPDPDVGYGEFPHTLIEEPGTHPSLYPEGATPDVFLREGLAPREATAGSRGVELWMRHQDAPPGEDGVNLNLDADRGFNDRCWRVTPGRSITQNPVSVQVLA